MSPAADQDARAWAQSLGPWGFGVSGPLATPLMRDAQVSALVHQALEGGVRLFDTAPFYGEGAAERRLGAALGAHPRGREALVSTKVGTTWKRGRPVKDFSPAGADRALAASAARLGRARLDIVWLHGAPPAHAHAPLLDALAHWRSAGRLGRVGLCAREADIDALLQTPPLLEGVSLLMTPAYRGVDAAQAQRLAAARAQGLAIIGIETLKPALHRWRTPRRLSDVWHLTRAALRPAPARPPAASVSQCLDWALSAEGPDMAMLSTTRPAHLAASLTHTPAARARPLTAASARDLLDESAGRP